MSVMNVVTFSTFLAAASSAAAATVEEFCQNLTALESHLSDELLSLIEEPEYESAFECGCEEGGDTFSLTVKCDEKDLSTGEYTYFEQAAFELQPGGRYILTKSWWGNEDVTEEVNYFGESGDLTSCKGNACTSCEICEDGLTIKLDCSDVAWWNDFTLAEECGAYAGSLLNTFDFGEITGESGSVVETPTESDTLDGENFCQNLDRLEDHLSKSWETFDGRTYTSEFECICSGLDDVNSFEVYCSNEIAYESIEYGAVKYVSTEYMCFVLVDGEYILKVTYWGYQDEVGDFGEVFDFTGGVLSGCNVGGCDLCEICPDGQSIQSECVGSSYTCVDGYTGAFANSFEFGMIRGPSSTLPSDASGLPTTGFTTSAAAITTIDTEEEATSVNVISSSAASVASDSEEAATTQATVVSDALATTDSTNIAASSTLGFSDSIATMAATTTTGATALVPGTTTAESTPTTKAPPEPSSGVNGAMEPSIEKVLLISGFILTVSAF
ncbi:hypothetical protein ACHAWF_012892 [Thalassiosira exigua]